VEKVVKKVREKLREKRREQNRETYTYYYAGFGPYKIHEVFHALQNSYRKFTHESRGFAENSRTIPKDSQKIHARIRRTLKKFTHESEGLATNSRTPP